MMYFLIGYMASGKSTFANRMAAKLKGSVIDTDFVIEYLHGVDVAEIFELRGEQYFREFESKILEESILLRPGGDVIIACGGGMPCFGNNLELMKKNGKVIYLKCTPETILSRLTDEEIEKRPLLNKHRSSSLVLLNDIAKGIEERETYYNQADIILNEDELNKFIEDL